jgi:cytidyltransferase-like protein
MRQRSQTIATYSFPEDWSLEERTKWQNIRKAVQQAKEEGRRVVFATGVFDLFHEEHQRFLEKARAAGNFLVVGVESDFRVREMKGQDRPLDVQEIRLQHVRDSGVVDEAEILPEHFSRQEHFQAAMALIRPHFLAVSSHSSYLENKRLLTELYGGQLAIVHQHNPAVSTTQILQQRTMESEDLHG